MECLIAFRLQLGLLPLQSITIRTPTGDVQHESITLTRKIGYLGRQATTLELRVYRSFLARVNSGAITDWRAAKSDFTSAIWGFARSSALLEDAIAEVNSFWSDAICRRCFS